MTAPEIIQRLVQQFEANRDAYRSGRYNEAQLRQEFLNPFFEALGWDVSNQKGYSIDYREVVHEDSIDVEGGARAPDYAFRIGGVRKFFVEAKKPAVDIQYDIHPAYQLRRYAWNVHLPLSILTDFEEFAVYDCRNKPIPSDSAATARVMFIKYTQFVEKWDEIAAIFTPQAIQKGAFDKYSSDKRSKKGTTEVDDAFLQDIETWRTLLARNIALRNPQVADERQLNFAVQMTIDRIIFLRISEDRGIEPESQLLDMCKTHGIYTQLVALFQRADLKYNSGLFHFNQEKGVTSPADTFTPDLSIDDRVLKEILKSLYYPCPYIFKEIPVEILGQVYEQFLGKVIRLTPGRMAKVEEKPEVRKAGGVYYTPTYIVDYIIKNTVGTLLEGRTPENASALKIVDPACGSGSFLLGAFQYLLDWHETWYHEHDPEKWSRGKAPALIPTQGGDWKLSTAEKKSILVNNIHGVDIDAQAVEVTKLSLLLKVLEEETGQLSLGLERALPDLGENIRCGNSLIGWDYFEGKLLVDEAERERVNPFDWQRAFPQVFAQGGFDAVIGNPPYIRIQAMKEWAPTEVEFYKKRYIAASKGNYDIYVVFVEKGLSLLNQSGRLGYILPHKFFNAQYGRLLRGLIARGKHLSKVVNFGDQQVFENATTYTCLMFLHKSSLDIATIVKVSNLEKWRNGNEEEVGKGSLTSHGDTEWNFSIGKSKIIIEKLSLMPITLSSLTKRIFQGLVTGADSVFILKKVGNSEYYSERTNKTYYIEEDLIHPLCKGSVNIRRYYVTDLEKSILFPYKVINRQAILLSKKELLSKYPVAWRYLEENRQTLEMREHGKWKHERWYALGRNQNLTEMEQKKILTPSIAKQSSFTLDANDYFYFIGSGGGGGGGYGITFFDNEKMAYEYFLGLLNSQLLDFYIKSYSSPFSGGYFAYNRQYIERLPIRTIDFDNHTDVQRHDRMVSLVERMLALHKRKPATPQEQERLAREISATDAEIDRLVYELYDLTEEEIRIVEGG